MDERTQHLSLEVRPRGISLYAVRASPERTRGVAASASARPHLSVGA